MPRINRGRELTEQYNALVPQAQSLGIRARPRANMHGDRSRIAAMIESLRNEIAQYNTPVSVASTLRTFGVEFEFYLPRTLTRAALAAMLTNAGIDTREEGYNHNRRTWWKIVTDASLGYARGAELVSPPLQGEQGFEQVRKQLRQLIAAGCRVNQKCGFHVHVGVANEQVSFFKNLVKLYHKYEPVIDQIMSPSRRRGENRYADTLHVPYGLDGVNSIDHLRNLFGISKQFRKLNLFTFWRQGTVEFRQHQGTIDPLKADMWIRFCLRMVEVASKKSEQDLLNEEVTLDALLFLVEAENSEKEFFKRRHAHFSTGGLD